MKQKQLAKGIDQLMDEGVAQLFINQFNGRKIIGTVGQLQFEVIQYRLENEYNAKCRWEPISLYKACWVESDDPEELEAFKKRKYQYMAKDREGRDVFLADSNYVLQAGARFGVFYELLCQSQAEGDLTIKALELIYTELDKCIFNPLITHEV
jgi:peptide subunit release factor RF-3